MSLNQVNVGNGSEKSESSELKKRANRKDLFLLIPMAIVLVLGLILAVAVFGV